MGRDTKLTPTVQEKIVAVIRSGGYLETAAAHAGVNVSVFREWLRRGERERVRRQRGERGRTAERIYLDFSGAVEKALADAESRFVALVNRAASGYDVTKIKKILKRGPTGRMELVEETTEISHVQSWQAAMTLLERRWPGRWARREVIDAGDCDELESDRSAVCGGSDENGDPQS